jgi:hypothetical protein
MQYFSSDKITVKNSYKSKNCEKDDQKIARIDNRGDNHFSHHCWVRLERNCSQK